MVADKGAIENLYADRQEKCCANLTLVLCEVSFFDFLPVEISAVVLKDFSLLAKF
jgi:hypothetical protein